MFPSDIAQAGKVVTSATVKGLLGIMCSASFPASFATSVTSHCHDYEYYDVTSCQCRHCDTACFDIWNGTIISFKESQCFKLCPGYIKDTVDHSADTAAQSEEALRYTLMGGGLSGFLLALIIVCIIVVVILRRELSSALNDTPCCRQAKTESHVSSSLVGDNPSEDVGVMVDRVTSV